MGRRVSRGDAQSFSMGQLLMTAGAQAALVLEDVWSALGRHARGDWGEIDETDRRENELALREGLRLMSVYRDRQQCRFWIITEADRSATTVLLPEEY